MKTCPIESITISPERQRREFKEGDLQSLAASIQENGLFHAPTLREDGGNLILVSGERRLRAISDIYALGGSFKYDGNTIPQGEVPYVTLGELGPLEREEAELEENIRRVDLTWQERATATSRLAALRTRQADTEARVAPSVSDIALETKGSGVGRAFDTTRKEMLVAKHLDKPEVAAAKNVEDAFKILKRVEEKEKHQQLAASVGRTFTADLHRAFQADSQEWLRGCAAESFDVILTDPPYGMGADEFADSGGKTAGGHGYADSPDVLARILEWLPAESFRVAKPEAHLYLFCDIDSFTMLRERFAVAGWTCFRTPIIWHKSTAVRAPWPEHGPQRKWEMCLYAMKGKRKVTKLYGDLVTYAPDPNFGHAAQKPVALFEDLLQRSVRPGDAVLDAFAGTGTIFPAAHRLKCSATGIELDQAAYGICLKRLEALKAQGELPL